MITVTLQGQRTTPFKIRGLHVDDEFAEHYHPEWNGEVDQHLDRNLARRRIGDVLEDLDDRVVTVLQDKLPASKSRRGRRPPRRSSGAAVDLPASIVE